MGKEHDQLALLVEAVLASSKYKDVCRELIVSIGMQELNKRRSVKEAIKATKNILHQVSGAYFDTREQYADWLSQLRTAAAAENEEPLVQACIQIMSHHASTRERIPLLDEFYRAIFAHLPPVHTILDIACGLHPLALPWIQRIQRTRPLRGETAYYAYDIHHNMMDFLGAWLQLSHVQGYAHVCDVIHSCPTQRGDVAFLLKAIPCLEQIDTLAGTRLLHALNVDHLVVSFPVASLGGRRKGMVEYYEAHFRGLVADERWEIIKLEFRTELVFVIRK